MDFIFFTAADKPLFIRNDAETANWTVEEMSLELLFPYDPDKVITRGMRVAFYDDDGDLQPFEIRKVKSYEPDHYQEVTAEHIVISELSDRVFAQANIEDKTAQQALTTLLSGTGWNVGTVSASGTSTVKLSNTSVWAAIAQIKTNWNVYITPRVTWNANGITGRYLDVQTAGATWRGLYLSIDSNADSVGVTYDDSEVKTALYGYGGEKQKKNGRETVKEILTFKDVVWTATDAHPAKPANQTYIEDPAATALYGRNGQPRFGFYQNSDIETGELLLEKTWETLKTVREPLVSIDCTVHNLYKLGYSGVPVRLHDLANVNVSPMGINLQREVIRLSVDLLNSLQTRVTIGSYIPNIIYIAKETTKAATGGGGSGQSTKDYERGEFETKIEANAFEINLRAYQVDLESDVSLLYSFIDITAEGIRLEVGNNVSALYSSITQTAASIRLEVSRSNSQIYSTITQTADSIRLEVNNANSGIYSAITQTADSIRLEVRNANSGIYSAITQTADSIRLEVRNANSGIYSAITQTADSIRLEVRNANSGIYSAITQTADSIRLEVRNANSGIYSAITQTADSIRLEVRNSMSGVYSSITQTAESIRLEVNRSNSQIYSSITETADCIRLEVGNAQSNIYSSIEQNANKISLVVTSDGGTDKIDVASIVLGINDQTEGGGSFVKIKASTVDLGSYATVSELNAMSARITNLTSGNSTAGTLRANNLYGGAFSMNGHAHHNSNITIDGVTYNIVTWQ